MNKLKIVLADTDENYLAPLERKFIDEFENIGEIHVITDKEYLRQYFSAPQSLDILLIDETVFDMEMVKHDIGNIFILTEQSEKREFDNWNISYINKYTSVKEICSEVMDNMATDVGLSAGESTKIIMVYSPIGGIGKTTVAAGLCGALAQKHKRVLFIGTDTLQTFGYLVEGGAVLAAGLEKYFVTHSENIYEELKPYIKKGLFHILPPFIRALSSLNITGSDYAYLIDKIKTTGEYDYIIIDSSSDFTEHTSLLMGKADYKLILVGQDRNSAGKLACLLNNIDCSDTSRYIFVCNKYRSDKENMLVTSEYLSKCRIKEYVDFEDNADLSDCRQASGVKSIQALSFTFV